MLAVSNGQVSAALAGVAASSHRLYYLSIIGTQTEIRSMKAGIVTGKRISVPHLGTINHKKGEPWREFSTPIPNSPFVHYVWLATDPAFVFVTNPVAAEFLDDSKRDENRKRLDAMQADINDNLAPMALWRNLGDTHLPIPQNWAIPLFQEAKRTYKLGGIDRNGDCVYAALRSTDEKEWQQLISSLIRRGELQ